MPRQEAGEPYSRISVAEAAAMVADGDATVVDVRNRDEYEAGHVKNALWIPVDDVIPRYDDLPNEGALLFICAVGARSGLAAEYASAMGAEVSRLFNVEDGTQAWTDQGHPTSYGNEA